MNYKDQLAKLRTEMLSDDHKAQIEYEMQSVERGIENVRRQMSGETNLTDTEPGRHIFREQMELLTRPIAAAQEEAKDLLTGSQRGVKPTWTWLILPVPAPKLAFLTVRSILTVRLAHRSVGRKANAICLEIGNNVRMQTEFEKWARLTAAHHSETGEPDVAKVFERTAKNMNVRQWNARKQKLTDIETLKWSKEEKFHIGAKLLEIAIVYGGGFFELEYINIRGKTERQVFLTDLCRKMIEDCQTYLEVNTPVLRPMLCKPNPWHYNTISKQYEGGYFSLDVDLIRAGVWRHTNDLEDPLSMDTLRAANVVGNVPWQINEKAFDLVEASQRQASSLFDAIPDSEPIPLPARIDDDLWYEMTKTQRSEHKKERANVHTMNNRNQSKKESAARKMNIASEMKSLRHKQLHFVQKFDSRLRLYNVAPDLNPQGDTIARGLLQFSESEPLGDRGLYWMRVHLANMFGEDKISFEDMQTWVDDHHDLIVDAGRNPLDGELFWRDADRQLEFYAVAREYAEATALDNPESYRSHLPCHQDGSNNGLQLLSLLGRDPTGAQLTNCSASLERYDIYQTTADLLSQVVSRLAADGDQIAHRWVGRINRKTCKRATLTTPYGVTPRGIQDQLIDDGFVEGLEGTRMENAGWLKGHLIDALEQTVIASRPIMTYFQTVASTLAAADRPLRWRTPTGSTVQQSYWNIAKSDVKTVMGSYFLWSQNPDGGLNKRKQSHGSAPNVIHSLDAALLQKVVCRLSREGVSSLSTVHDSFAVHFRHVDQMRDIIRQEAYSIFKGDWLLDEFHRYVQSNSPVELPEPPKQGTFDINEVLNAPYFFS